VAILALALFGSRARDDAAADADVDLLAVTSDRKPATTVRKQLRIPCYPLGEMIAYAGLGDLFVLHVVTEGRVIYEAWPVFERIRRAFRYNGDYAREIRLATDVGWLLARFGDRLSSARVLNARIAWCTRTILIARAAAQGRPVFGARQLAEFCGSPDVVTLIHNKNSGERDPEMVAKFTEVLRAFGAQEPPVPETLDEQKRIFEADRNVPGLRLLDRLMT
jgi:predicted nucleotidyltransferase